MQEDTIKIIEETIILPIEAGQQATSPEDNKKCECGVSTLYGKDCPLEYHSDYCPLYKKP